MREVPLLEVSAVTLTYRRAGKSFVAVKDAGLTVSEGEVIGIVGESGSGKSSLARCVMGLVRPDSGTVRLQGESVGTRRTHQQRRFLQMVFQDPRSALNPRMSAFRIVNEAWQAHPEIAPEGPRRAAAAALLARVGLDESALDRRPEQASGGQAQRLSIARALAVAPRVLVLDEAVSALDVTVQSQILRLLAKLRADLGLAMVFISHDLGVIRQIADRVSVMHLGEVVETGDTGSVFDSPQHEYTKTLLAGALDLTVSGTAG